MLNKLMFSTNSPLRRLFTALPYRWQLKIILAVWEVIYRRRRCRWQWAGCHLSAEMPNFGVGQPGLVSVVLPVYNHADTLAIAINSVLQQSYPTLELIIVNDGSTDNTPHILSQFEHYQNVTIVHQPNQGLPAALNKGFSLAKGEYFTWTSADNLMHPEQVARLVAHLSRHPDVALVYADFELIDEQGETVPDAAAIFMRGKRGSSMVHLKPETDRLNVGFESVIGPCFLYRSFVTQLIGEYNQSLSGAEDFDFWIRMNNFFQLEHLNSPQPLYRYRIHKNRMSVALKPAIGVLRRWLMNREQQFQQRLNSPAVIAIDNKTQNLVSSLIPQGLPHLNFVSATDLCSSVDAVLLHISSLDAVLASVQKIEIPLLCWAFDNDIGVEGIEKYAPQVDLMILGGLVLPSLKNTISATTKQDVFHFTRIYVGSRLNSTVTSCPALQTSP